MVASSPGLTNVRNFLTQHGAAGFMRNTVRVPGETCVRCTGMVKPGWDSCYPCERSYPGRGADRLGFLTYAWHPHQSGTVMRGYKAPVPTPTAVKTVSNLIAYGVVGHYDCMSVSGHGVPRSWATVPSLPAKIGPHPLERIVGPLFPSDWPRPQLQAAGAITGSTRDFRPNNFVVPGGASGHVLLVDDTWASGGHVESAAAALKAAGASYVTALLVARWLTPGWENTSPFISGRLTSDYDPDVCPFTAAHC